VDVRCPFCRRELPPALKSCRPLADEEPTTTSGGLLGPGVQWQRGLDQTSSDAPTKFVHPRRLSSSPAPHLPPCFWQRELQLWELGFGRPCNGAPFSHFSRVELLACVLWRRKHFLCHESFVLMVYMQPAAV
jgi:hypothetical protein